MASQSDITEQGSSRTVRAGDIDVHYHDVGSGDPIVLLHSYGPGTTGWITFHKILPALAQRYRCIVMDLPNFGRTGPVTYNEPLHNLQARTALALMDTLGIEKAHLVGNSQGGQSAMVLAMKNPERVNKLVNVAGGGTATRPLQNMVDFKVPTAEQITEQIANRFPEGSVNVGELAATFIKKAEDPGQGEAFAGVMRHMTNPMTRPRYNTLRRMPLIKAPTLVLWGRDDATNNVPINAKATPTEQISKYFHIASSVAGFTCRQIRNAEISVVASIPTHIKAR
ncbi:MAG: alpha/beta fold hydrolase [Chloroflexi bacterium]|nr:alpha/beta fold hydrolase [Chloroflexota bacterium]